MNNAKWSIVQHTSANFHTGVKTGTNHAALVTARCDLVAPSAELASRILQHWLVLYLDATPRGLQPGGCKSLLYICCFPMGKSSKGVVTNMKRHFMVKHRRVRVAWLLALATLVVVVMLHLRTESRHDGFYAGEDPGKFTSRGLYSDRCKAFAC